jgi:SAM-dependent methyltransferase
MKETRVRSIQSTLSRQALIESYDRHYTVVGQLRDTDAFYQWVLEKLNPRPSGSLLDVACGEGHLLKYAQQRGMEAIGSDFSANAVLLVQTILGANAVALADGEELPFEENTFDYVTNLGSLEHFSSPQTGLSEMRRVVRDDGYIVLVLPNSYYLLDIIWHVWRNGYPVSHRQTIERFGTVNEWRDFIEENGLKVENIYKYNLCFPRSYHDWLWYLRSPLKFAYPLSSPFIPLNLSYSFLYICRVA